MQINFTRENEYRSRPRRLLAPGRRGFRPERDGRVLRTPAALQPLRRRQRAVLSARSPCHLRAHRGGQDRAQDLPYKQVPDSLDFHMVRALLQSYQGEPREQVANFDRAIAEKKYNNEVAEHYGLVASLLRARIFRAPKVELAKLEKIAPPHPMVEAMAGNVLMGANESAAAVARFESALARYPNKMQLIHDYPEALIKAGRPADASAFAERELLRFPGEGPLHEIAARAYAAQDKRLKQHSSIRESSTRGSATCRCAIDQFQLAAKSGDGDFYQLSVVESRLRVLRQEMAEQQRAWIQPVGIGRAGRDVLANQVQVPVRAKPRSQGLFQSDKVI